MRDLWSVNEISEETLVDRRTVKKILGETAPIDPSPKGDRYYLSDFMEAYKRHLIAKTPAGDLEAEKTRLTAAQADIAEVERAKLRNQVIDTEAGVRFFENLAMPIRRIIELSLLTNIEKDQIFNLLSSINLEAIINATMDTEGVIEGDGPQVPALFQPAGTTHG